MVSFAFWSVLFPLAFEVINSLGLKIFIEYLFYSVMGFFILFIMLSFFAPLSKIKEKAESEKTKKILDSDVKLQAMTTKYLLDLERDIPIQKLAQVYLYTQQHLRLYEMKNFPFELKTLLEMLISIVIPVGIFILQITIK